MREKTTEKEYNIIRVESDIYEKLLHLQISITIKEHKRISLSDTIRELFKQAEARSLT
jgi:predicted CopG family antitoxin